MARLVIVNENAEQNRKKVCVRELKTGTWFTVCPPFTGNYLYLKLPHGGVVVSSIGSDYADSIGSSYECDDDTIVHTILETPKFKIET